LQVIRVSSRDVGSARLPWITADYAQLSHSAPASG
jgi:hypothetical protein